MVTYQQVDEFLDVRLVECRRGCGVALLAGIDCNRYMKINYARLEQAKWEDSHDTWKPIGNLGYNNYPAYLAKKGLCAGDSANSQVTDIVQKLKEPPVYGIY